MKGGGNAVPVQSIAHVEKKEHQDHVHTTL